MTTFLEGYPQSRHGATWLFLCLNIEFINQSFVGIVQNIPYKPVVETQAVTEFIARENRVIELLAYFGLNDFHNRVKRFSFDAVPDNQNINFSFTVFEKNSGQHEHLDVARVFYSFCHVSFVGGTGYGQKILKLNEVCEIGIQVPAENFFFLSYFLFIFFKKLFF